MAKVLVALIGLLGLSFTLMAQAVTLVGTPYPTFVDPNGVASRYTDIVEEAFKRMRQPLDVQVVRQAFVGSALRGERADGEVTFIALNQQTDRLLYSQAYANVDLYLASRDAEVEQVQSFSYISNQSVATENRFANTAQLRPLDIVRWSRNPTAFDAFRQLADGRANYLLADKRLIDEFNLMLASAKRPVLFMSPAALVQTSVHISLRRSLPDAAQIIARFNQAISEMREDGTLEALLKKAENGSRDTTLLDSARYKKMMRNW